MILHVRTDGDGRIVQSMEPREEYDFMFDGFFEFEFPNDFDVYKQGDYIIKNGELIYDGLYTAAYEARKLEHEIEETKNAQMNVAAAMFVKSQPLPRQEAISVCYLYDEWSPNGVKYKRGLWVRYNGDIYHIEQDHTSQETWKPDVSHSLFTRYKLAPDGIRIWEPPTHAETSFDIDEKCHYPDADGKIYVSKINGNTTIPGSDDRYWALF